MKLPKFVCIMSLVATFSGIAAHANVAAIPDLSDARTPVAESAQNMAKWTLTSFKIDGGSAQYNCTRIFGAEGKLEGLGRDSLVGRAVFTKDGCRNVGSEALSFMFFKTEGNPAPHRMAITHYRVDAVLTLSDADDDNRRLMDQLLTGQFGKVGRIVSRPRADGQETIYLGRRTEMSEYLTECKVYYSAFLGVRNPLARRTMECRGYSLNGERVLASFIESHY